MDFMDCQSEKPVSPIGQYMNTPSLSLSILAILEFQVPIHSLDINSFLKDVFLPINPRFSSIMVTNEKGKMKWKRVNVKVEEHVKDPIFPSGLTTESYKSCFDDYMTEISMEQYRPDKPLWEFHLFKYPTSKSTAGTVVLKLHHSLGDGYSLMGVVLCCLHRASDPRLPLTFPSKRQPSVVNSVPRIVSSICRTVSDLGRRIFRSKDDQTPIRSGRKGVEFMPATTSTITLSLDDIKQIKTKLGVSVNDVITGIIFFGLRLYMQETKRESGRARSSLLTILNTRRIGSYRSATELMKAESSKGLWGNRLSYLQIRVPKLSDAKFSNPVEFVKEAHQSIKRKRSSFIVHITAHMLNLMRKLRGHQEVAKFLHNLMKNSTTVISNMIGPMEQMAFDNYPLDGLYFTIVGTPQSLTITVFSYMGNLRVALRTEKGFINSQKLNSCMEDAFKKILKAANDIPAN